MRKILASLFIFVFMFFGLSANQAYAKFITENEGGVIIAKNEIINDDLFISAKSVTLDGIVNGDIFVAAESIKIGGTINGNMHTVAKIIDVSGVVRGNMYGGAQNVLINGAKINGSLLLGGASINVDENSVIGGSILAGAETLMIDSRVTRSVYAGAGNLNIGNATQIGKNLYYATGESKATISPDATILGSTFKSEYAYTKPNVDVGAMQKNAIKAAVATNIGMAILMFLGVLLVGFVYLKLAGKHFTETASIVTQSFWKSLGLGFLIAMAFVPAIIILSITVIGLPLAGIAVLVFILYSCLAGMPVSLALGNVLFKANKKAPVFGTFALGLLILKIVELIPFVGFMTGLVVFWSGLGALTTQLFTKQKIARS